MDKIVFSAYVIATVVFNLTENDILFYFAYILGMLDCYKTKLNTKGDYYLIKLCLYSIMIPSNYIILAALIYISFVNKNRAKSSYIIYSSFGGLYLLFNIIVNDIKMINLIFSIVYFIHIVFCMIFVDTLKLEEEEKENLISFLKAVAFLQGIALVTEYIFQHDAVVSAIDFDWVSGTFGIYQGNIFLFYFLFNFIVFFDRYRKKRIDICYVLVSIVYIVMTGAICLICIFAFVIFVYLMISEQIGKRMKIRALGLLIFLITSFMIITPAWITNAMVRIAETDDKSIYISKLIDYENVYMNPYLSTDYEIIGVGVGNYSSRAALTCTGIYLPTYNAFFEPSMSDFTTEYIYNKLNYCYDNKLGTLDTPFSEFISIKGEFGYIGIVFLLLFFILLYSRNKNTSRIYIMFLFFSCFVENYLEFAKIVVLLYFSIIYFREKSS